MTSHLGSVKQLRHFRTICGSIGHPNSAGVAGCLAALYALDESILLLNRKSNLLRYHRT
ncbi:hypothetical protein BLAT2472_40472 [Burkholderia latens]